MMTPHERILRLAMASVAKRKLINYEGSSERWRRIAVPRATIGRQVHYRLAEGDNHEGKLPDRAGFIPSAYEWEPGEYAPATVVGTYPDFEKVSQVVDLQVLVGPARIYIRGVPEGTVNGSWCWPPRN